MFKMVILNLHLNDFLVFLGSLLVVVNMLHTIVRVVYCTVLYGDCLQRASMQRHYGCGLKKHFYISIIIRRSNEKYWMVVDIYTQVLF